MKGAVHPLTPSCLPPAACCILDCAGRGWYRPISQWQREKGSSGAGRGQGGSGRPPGSSQGPGIQQMQQQLERCAQDLKYRSRLCNHWDSTLGTFCPMRCKVGGFSPSSASPVFSLRWRLLLQLSPSACNLVKRNVYTHNSCYHTRESATLPMVPLSFGFETTSETAGAVSWTTMVTRPPRLRMPTRRGARTPTASPGASNASARKTVETLLRTGARRQGQGTEEVVVGGAKGEAGVDVGPMEEEAVVETIGVSCSSLVRVLGSGLLVFHG